MRLAWSHWKLLALGISTIRISGNCGADIVKAFEVLALVPGHQSLSHA